MCSATAKKTPWNPPPKISLPWRTWLIIIHSDIYYTPGRADCFTVHSETRERVTVHLGDLTYTGFLNVRWELLHASGVSLGYVQLGLNIYNIAERNLTHLVNTIPYSTWQTVISVLHNIFTSEHSVTFPHSKHTLDITVRLFETAS